MPLKTETVRFGANKQHTAHAAHVALAAPGYGLPVPPTPSLPAVLVLQEAWGVDEHIHDVCARLARAGYYAFAPDLYAENGMRPVALHRPRLQSVQALVNKGGAAMFNDADARAAALAELKEPLRSEVTESFDAMRAALAAPPERYLPVLQDAVSFLLDDNAPTKGEKVGAIGFCFGGGLAGRLACADARLSASIACYGRPPSAEELARLAKPLLALHGALDAGLVAQLPALRDARHVEVVVYEGAPHAFLNDARPSWHAASARAAWPKALSFFAAHLG
jgi:carboxymethylenebutenolidase